MTKCANGIPVNKWEDVSIKIANGDNKNDNGEDNKIANGYDNKTDNGDDNKNDNGDDNKTILTQI